MKESWKRVALCSRQENRCLHAARRDDRPVSAHRRLHWQQTVVETKPARERVGDSARAKHPCQRVPHPSRHLADPGKPSHQPQLGRVARQAWTKYTPRIENRCLHLAQRVAPPASARRPYHWLPLSKKVSAQCTARVG